MADDALTTIKQTYFVECDEQLAELESGLIAIEDGDRDPETINAVFRAVHSIKGGAGAFHFEDLVRFSHVFETALDRLRSGQIEASPQLTKVMLRAADTLADLVQATRDGGAIEAEQHQPVLDELELLGLGSDAAAAADDFADLGFVPIAVSFDDVVDDGADDFIAPDGRRRFTVRFKPLRSMYRNANEAGLLLRALSLLGDSEISCDASDLPMLDELDAEESYLRWIIKLTTEDDEAGIRHVFEFVEDDCELEIWPGHAVPAADATLDMLEDDAALRDADASPVAAFTPGVLTGSANGAQEPAVKQVAANSNTPAATIRVEIDRVDRLVDLIGELVINQAMLAQRFAEFGLERGSPVALSLDEHDRLTRGIQNSVMAIRAQPVKSVFQRMSRVVREVAAMTGKVVHLETEGEGTEVDKTVIEHLSDPLTHMLRNAIDHGIERPEARVAAGKPAEGLVRLSATHRSGRIIIEIADDGAGINRARVSEIAVGKGLISPDAIMSDEEIDELIFHPGFSTAQEVSNLSGRGVGMDVVRKSIQALGGRISIVSRPGQGSTFTLSLPLTLAVLDGMIVKVAGETLVLPLASIVETLQPKSESLRGFGVDDKLILARGAVTPVIDVGLRLGYRAAPADPLGCVVILVESERGGRCALLVDGILEQRQIVIKSLEKNYGIIPGIAAATILGDGRVALIADVDAVISDSGASHQPHPRLQPVQVSA